MAAQKQDDQLERTFSSYARIQDVVLKTYLGRWTIGKSGERGSEISVLPARYDDDDDDDDDFICRLLVVIPFSLVNYYVLWHDFIIFGNWLFGFSYYPINLFFLMVGLSCKWT